MVCGFFIYIRHAKNIHIFAPFLPPFCPLISREHSIFYLLIFFSKPLDSPPISVEKGMITEYHLYEVDDDEIVGNAIAWSIADGIELN